MAVVGGSVGVVCDAEGAEVVFVDEESCDLVLAGADACVLCCCVTWRS